MWMRRVAVDVLLACVTGTLLVASFPPLSLGGLAWIALVPLVVTLRRRGPLGAFGLSYLAGLVFIVGSFGWIWWVPAYNLVDEALLAFYLAGYVATWGLGVAWIHRRTACPVVLVAPALWVALEYLRSNASFLSLPWMLLGHTQHGVIPLIQVASLTGAYGVSFLVVLVNVTAAETLVSWRSRIATSPRGGAVVPAPLGALVSTALLVAATWLYGISVTQASVGGERLTAGLLQTSVPRDRKWDPAYRRSILERYEELTRQAAQSRPLLIVSPETAVPGDVEHHAVLRQRIASAAREANAFLLVGSSEHAKFSDRRLIHSQYNSAYLFSPSGEIVGQYRKIILVPFGEYEPLRGVVRWPKVVAAAVGSHLSGDRYTVFTAAPVPFSAAICWEIAFPDLVRRFVQGGARLVVNASNEAWFAGSAMPEQMLAMSVFRAVENRVSVARSANLGISATIDPFGRVTRRFAGSGADEATDGVLVGDLRVGAPGTFYTRHGDVFAFACVAASAMLLVGASLGRAARRVLHAALSGTSRRRTDVPSAAADSRR
jgi:apolipoprotein N-acyltransferase